MSKFFEIPKLIRAVYNYENTIEYDYGTINRVAAFFGIVIYIVNFKNVDDLKLVLSAYLVGTALFAAPIVLNRARNKKNAILLFIFFLGTVLTLYGLFGVNEGISFYWSFLAILVIMIQFGMPLGIPWGTYFLVFSIVIFWTPVKHMLPFVYPDEFSKSFPFMYFCAFVTSFVADLYYKKSRIERERQDMYLQKDLEDALAEIDQAMIDSVAGISQIIDEKDSYTRQHSMRVAEYTSMLADECGYSRNPQKRRSLYNAALLHDIGKVAVPDNILNNKINLSDEEFAIMKKHTSWGAEILEELSFLPNIEIGAKYHHERFDGKGYPEGIAGNDIPLEGRIIAVADTLDAMNSERVYRKPCSREHILETFENGKGTQFDEQIADNLCRMIREGKIKIVAEDIKAE